MVTASDARGGWSSSLAPKSPQLPTRRPLHSPRARAGSFATTLDNWFQHQPLGKVLGDWSPRSGHLGKVCQDRSREPGDGASGLFNHRDDVFIVESEKAEEQMPRRDALGMQFDRDPQR